jgi:uncharacterized coiled-coil DUF342 family protein
MKEIFEEITRLEAERDTISKKLDTLYMEYYDPYTQEELIRLAKASRKRRVQICKVLCKRFEMTLREAVELTK